VTKKIWVSVSSENQGYIERCDACGVTQPDSASAFRQLHEEDCLIAPGPTDLLERIEGLSKPRSEEPDEEIENERIRKAQDAREKREQGKRSREHDELDRKIQEGHVIATARSSDSNWKKKGTDWILRVCYQRSKFRVFNSSNSMGYSLNRKW
jgi:hypothetical protein